ncbi:hypothetical protein [Candidatus Clostridium stratigraminis]|uniref:Uncharacterized protein n=1 Tax=Candidatus Clostridium stratigraminis TaxID=3381661 RepID=A0ABW8T182_9CLOT
MNTRYNLSHIKYYGIGIPKKGELATIEDEEKVKRLIRSVKPMEVEEMVDELNTDGNKIVL